jgi:hypothetical protein
MIQVLCSGVWYCLELRYGVLSTCSRHASLRQTAMSSVIVIWGRIHGARQMQNRPCASGNRQDFHLGQSFSSRMGCFFFPSIVTHNPVWSILLRFLRSAITVCRACPPVGASSKCTGGHFCSASHLEFVSGDRGTNRCAKFIGCTMPFGAVTVALCLGITQTLDATIECLRSTARFPQSNAMHGT